MAHHDAYSMCLGYGSICLARIRMGSSGLNDHLHKLKIIDSPFCSHCNVTETPEHYFMHCPRYSDIRKCMLDSISYVLLNYGHEPPYVWLDIIMFGGDSLPTKCNSEILKLTAKFIVNSRRFI